MSKIMIMIMTAICIVLLFNMEKTFHVLEGSTITVLRAELSRCGGEYMKQTRRKSWDLSGWSSKVVCLMFVDPCIIVLFVKKFQQDATMYQNFFIIPHLYEAQHVSGDTPPIIRSLKLHWQPLVFRTWKVVGCVAGLCLTMSTSYTSNNLPCMKNHRLPVQF